MTGQDVFLHTFKDLWFEYNEPNRKTTKWIKVVDRGQRYMGDVVSNTPVIIVWPGNKIGKSKRSVDKIARFSDVLTTLSYYKLFTNCKVVEDQKKLDELIVLEAKLRLISG